MQKEECILILLFRDRLAYQLLEVFLFYLDNFESKVKLDLLRQLDIRRQIIRKYYLRYVRTVQKIYSLKQKKKIYRAIIKKVRQFQTIFEFFVLYPIFIHISWNNYILLVLLTFMKKFLKNIFLHQLVF